MAETATKLSDLGVLADLLRIRNATEVAISRIIGRPAQLGHIGEFIASRIFHIELEKSGVNPGADGRFMGGPLAGKSVNIKMYSKNQSVLDITEANLPDYYLVLAGPRAPAISSRGTTRPWVIDNVFLFEARGLVDRLRARGVHVGIASSVVSADWKPAQIYPPSEAAPLAITEEQGRLLRLFGNPS